MLEFDTDHHHWTGEHGIDTIYLYRDGQEVYPAEFETWDEAVRWIKDWETLTYGAIGEAV